MWFLPEVISYLNETLGIRVSTTAPEKVTKPIVTVVYTGGQSDGFVERPSCVFHAWANTDLEAMQLIYQVADALFALPGHSNNIARAEQNSIYSNVYTDGTPRWSATFDFVTNR